MATDETPSTATSPSEAAPTDAPITETELRERQDVLVRALSVEQNPERLQAYSDELEAVQRQLEQVRSR